MFIYSQVGMNVFVTRQLGLQVIPMIKAKRILISNSTNYINSSVMDSNWSILSKVSTDSSLNVLKICIGENFSQLQSAWNPSKVRLLFILDD